MGGRRSLGAVVVAFAVVASCGSNPTETSSSLHTVNVDDDDILEAMQWSPDGRHLVIQVLAGDSIRGELLLVDGSHLRSITPETVDVTSFAWMPDSQTLAVAQSPNVDGGRSSSTIALLDLDGNERGTIAPEPALRIWYGMTVAPDGSTIVAGAGLRGPSGYNFDSQLWSIDVSSGTAEKVDADLGPDGIPENPQFESGGRVVTTVRTARQPGGYGDDHLVAIDLESLDVERVTPSEDNVAEFTLRACANTVIYTSVGPYQGGGVQPVFVRSLVDTADSARVADVRAKYVAASSTGTVLAYSTYVPFQEGPDVHIQMFELPACGSPGS